MSTLDNCSTIAKEKTVKSLIKIIFCVIFTFQMACSESDSGQNHKDQTYLLSLSWSPTYCLLDADGKKDHAQCDNAKKQYRMIVHGSWPQPDHDINSAKDHLKYCDQNPDKVPAQIVSEIFDIMPSSGLIQHAWRKHGTCAGMSQKAYFEKTKALYKEFKIDAILQTVEKSTVMLKNQIINDVLETSSDLGKENFVITCKGRMMKELRICLDNNFKPRKCGLDERRATCRNYKIYVPVIR